MGQRTVLCILDGWGYSEVKESNAVTLAPSPIWHNIIQNYPTANITTHGPEVGLSEGQMGNSEVGHMNLGAGRTVYQILPRINNLCKNKEFVTNEVLLKQINLALKHDSYIHLIGLVSDGGVHSHINHLIHLCDIIHQFKAKAWIHIITDGRDCNPQSANTYIEKLESVIADKPTIKIATVSGRYYSMDRDKRWERVQLAYNAIVNADSADVFEDPKQAVLKSYDNNINDEFILPTVASIYNGIQSNDVSIAFNFRTDRIQQILFAMLLKNFEEVFGDNTGLVRNLEQKLISNASMIEYTKLLTGIVTPMLDEEAISNTLGEVLAKAGKKQLRLAETEKFPHVTSFFNGKSDIVFEGEERILVPSPKVATYDLQPEMSAPEIKEKLITAMKDNKHDCIIVNFANGDMVGHTGDLEAAKKAVATLDQYLEEIKNTALENNYCLLVTADHGNCEQMWDKEANKPHTRHTTNLVKLSIIDPSNNIKSISNGKLGDIAPTMLHIMGLDIPSEMSGKVLTK